ncbi:putative 2-aminoethylphosphonate ABC transporter permease subunit [Paenibacillus sp. SYP-B3998]|uniref:Putative 2-aminoethylphosphonate ABC transporter permease subunit n=1 Tax=Paenibacillus sp. SYP-B3998 TaxID=2678564 RepID=A0A6G3ZY38_9BACL|nr:putative 2-aminoethylphosphonate ABC transporter permease subunit [Paenibacillus sp. SYP-B3998]NEW06968.1 putative 2-aminoethylphosphonate ABC transporter permease subunit [Paenibacillus sp. SYP-B3998]
MSIQSAIRRKFRKDDWLIRLLVILMLVVLFVAIVGPLGELFMKAFRNQQNEWVGFSYFTAYLTTPALSQSISHSLYVSTLTTLISVGAAFFYAYALTRTGMSGKRWFRYIALLPLFAPTMMHGIALTYLFGNQGLVTTGLFGLVPGFPIPLYGSLGIIISEIIYTFPQAFLILIVTFSIVDYRLYEAAQTLGAGKWKQFWTITLPQAKYGLIGSLFVCFTLSFTDFGAPKVVGGQYNVLPTDIYKQVIGQQNMSMGAVIGILLTLPALAAFFVDRFVERKQQSMVSVKSVPYQIAPNRIRDTLYTVYCSLVALIIGVLLLTVVFASLVKVWPYRLELSFKHYDFSDVSAGGLEPFWNSLLVAFLTAVIGTGLTFVHAYLIEKIRIWKTLRQLGYFLSLLPLALPGMVIGLGYIFFFNRPDNPLHAMYGTIWLVVLANVVHFYSVSFITATTSLKRLDKEYEVVSESMRVSVFQLFFRVSAPVSLPAIFEMAAYYFVNAMVTISAVVFLYSPDFKLASVSIVNMDDAGDVAAAAAMSTLILVANIVVRLGYELIAHRVLKRTEAWQKR